MATKQQEENNTSTLNKFKEAIYKNFGKASEIIVDDPMNIVIPKFKTGSYLLTADLKGGWPKGTLIEVYGGNGTGKTTLCISAVAEHQQMHPDEPILWVDLEKVFDPVYFTNLGIDISEDKFILARPNTGEQAWEIMINFAKIIEKGVIVLDSVALLLPIKEDEGQVGDAQMAAAARMNSQGLRKLFPYMGFGKTTMFAINQLRKNIGGYGDPNVTTGGEAWAFYARTRIATSSSKGEAGEYAIHKFKQVKANYGNKDHITETSINYGEGFDKMKELLALCVSEDIIKKSGSWYSYEETKLGQGADAVSETLKDNPDLVEIFEKMLIERGLL
jgi:recombination protein RecA